MRTKWLAVSIKGSARKSGSRLNTILQFLAERSLHAKGVVRDGTCLAFMRINTSMKPAEIEAMVERHPNVAAAYAN